MFYEVRSPSIHFLGGGGTFLLEKVDDFVLVILNTHAKSAIYTHSRTPNLRAHQKCPQKFDFFLCLGPRVHLNFPL